MSQRRDVYVWRKEENSKNQNPKNVTNTNSNGHNISNNSEGSDNCWQAKIEKPVTLFRAVRGQYPEQISVGYQHSLIRMDSGDCYFCQNDPMCAVKECPATSCDQPPTASCPDPVLDRDSIASKSTWQWHHMTSLSNQIVISIGPKNVV